MKITIGKAMVISSITWLLMGCWLLYKGLLFLYGAMVSSQEQFFYIFAGKSKFHVYSYFVAALVVSAFAGLFKGSFVMRKAAAKMVCRLRKEPELIPFSRVYPAAYLFLVLGMMCMGVALKYSGLSLEIRGSIDVAVGVALLSGAKEYLRYARQMPCKK